MCGNTDNGLQGKIKIVSFSFDSRDRRGIMSGDGKGLIRGEPVLREL